MTAKELADIMSIFINSYKVYIPDETLNALDPEVKRHLKLGDSKASYGTPIKQRAQVSLLTRWLWKEWRNNETGQIVTLIFWKNPGKGWDHIKLY